jgi:hypothetical protein
MARYMALYMGILNTYTIFLRGRLRSQVVAALRPRLGLLLCALVLGAAVLDDQTRLQPELVSLLLVPANEGGAAITSGLVLLHNNL